MDNYTLATGFAAASGLGLGVTAAIRILREQKNSRPVAPGKRTEKEKDLLKTPKGKGEKRRSQLLSLLPDGSIRLKNGGYLRGYFVATKETLFSRASEIENIYEMQSRMLTSDLPEGTGFQFRLSKHPDDGDALLEQKIELMSRKTHPIAALLKNNEIEHGIRLASKNRFNKGLLTLWLYVPGDAKKTNPFDIWKTHGFDGLRSSLKKNVVSRLHEEEKAVKKKCESYFRIIEQASPCRLTRMTSEEVWQAIYYGHNENARSAPRKPVNPFVDLESVICTENISASRESWYVLHGNTPVTAISLFLPPEDGAYATLMRTLANNPILTNRHTIITEYITVNKSKKENSIKKEIDSLKRLKTASERGKSVVFKFDEHKKKKLDELESVLRELANPGKKLLKLRFSVLVYGDPANTQRELAQSVEALEKNCENILAQIRRTMAGADAAREEPSALRANYEKLLIGEMDITDREREIIEQADALAVFSPLEGNWKGTVRPHNIFETTSGKLIGFNIFENPKSQSPLINVLGESGSGKSVLLAKIMTSVLAYIPKSRVFACDFGESFRPLAEALEGRNINFSVDNIRPINVWDYEGLERGIAPDDEQLEVVTADTLILCNINTQTDDGTLREKVIKKCVREVYKDIVPRNKLNVRREEPLLSHLVSKLKHFHFDSDREKRDAEYIVSLLEDFVGNPWLDAPTDELYRQPSAIDVFELNSLDKFPKDVRRTLAFRIGARLMGAIGETADGETLPTLIVFDEMHEIRNKPDFAVILKAVEKGARHGRKGMTRTILGTHTYDDLSDLHGLTSNSGMFIVGRQDNLDTLVKKHNWNETIIANITGIHNVAGSHAQFMLVLGKGDDSIAEMIQVSLSDLELWMYTTEANEKNARNRILREFPDWTMLDAIVWLAERYPFGLKLMNRQTIDEEFINAEKVMRNISLNVYAGNSAVPDENFSGPAQTAEGEIVEEELIEEVAELFRVVFGEEVDETAQFEKAAQQAQDLGVDIPGAFVKGEAIAVDNRSDKTN